MAYEKIIYAVDEDGIARITLNEPEKMNPLGWPLLAELDNALKEAEKDDNAKVIVIKGAGRSFSSGYDLAAGGFFSGEEPRGRKSYGTEGVWNSRAHVQGHISYWFNIWNLWKPVIAQVHGYWLAGASALASIHPELLSLTKRQVCRTFDIRGFRVSVEYGGEFDSLSHRGQDYGYQKTIQELGLRAGLKKLNEPWGGV